MGFFDSGSDEEYQKLTMSSYPFSSCYIIDWHLSVIGYPLAHLKNPKEGLLRRCEVAALVSAENTWGVGGGLFLTRELGIHTAVVLWFDV